MDLYVLIYMCLEPCISTTLETFIQFLKNLFFGWGGACCRSCGNLVLQLGIKPRPVAVRLQISNHWTTRTFP